MLKLAQGNAIVCDCGGTMKINGKGLAKACGATGDCNPATALCRGETDKLAEALLNAKEEGHSLLVACTQETSVFETLSEELGCDVPATVNIRALGWSDEGGSANPKNSCLLRHASDSQPATPSLALNSTGRCLIYADAGKPNGGADMALELGKRLKEKLGVTVLIANARQTHSSEAKIATLLSLEKLDQQKAISPNLTWLLINLPRLFPIAETLCCLKMRATRWEPPAIL